MEARKNVLVCEDDPVQLKILTTLLDQAGYRSLATRTPAEAVRAARRCGVDAVVTDVQLQDGSAFDLVGDLRRMGLDAPVIMASGYATDGMKERARKAGATTFFEKPFDLRQIREQVDQAVRLPRRIDGSVLIVEGHAQVRAGLERAAMEAGFSVLAAEDGAAALDLLRSTTSPVDLFLVDVHASEASTAWIIRSALEIRPSLHVVLMAGDASRDEIRDGYEAGAAAMVRKPIGPERFRSFLKQSLGTAREAQRREASRRERNERHSRESFARKAARVLLRGRRLAVAGVAAACLLTGAGIAYALQQIDSTVEKYDALADRAVRSLEHRGVSGDDAAFARWQAMEQLRLTRESNETSRRYYEGHLQEMRWQGQPRPVPAEIRTVEPSAALKK